MQLLTTTRKINAENVTNVVQYTINQKDFLSVMSILREMYSDPVKAVFREIVANARDAHIYAKQDRPFEVELPTELNPVFRVRDYGPGLTKEEAEALLFSYGSSGEYKRVSNDQIGGFGIGCKCPFAITDTFQIISYKDGTRYIWSCFLNEVGRESASLLEVSKTDEPNGLEVIIPIKDNSIIAKFQNVAPEIFYFYDKLPIIKANTRPIQTLDWNDCIKVHNTITCDKKQYELVYNVPYWYPSQYFDSQPYLIMGTIAYPIRINKFEEELTKAISKKLNIESLDTVKSVLHKLYSFNCFIVAPIGFVQVAPSREELFYNKRTNALLAHCLSDMVTPAFMNAFVQSIMQDKTSDFTKRIWGLNVYLERYIPSYDLSTCKNDIRIDKLVDYINKASSCFIVKMNKDPLVPKLYPESKLHDFWRDSQIIIIDNLNEDCKHYDVISPSETAWSLIELNWYISCSKSHVERYTIGGKIIVAPKNGISCKLLRRISNRYAYTRTQKMIELYKKYYVDRVCSNNNKPVAINILLFLPLEKFEQFKTLEVTKHPDIIIDDKVFTDEEIEAILDDIYPDNDVNIKQSKNRRVPRKLDDIQIKALIGSSQLNVGRDDMVLLSQLKQLPKIYYFTKYHDDYQFNLSPDLNSTDKSTRVTIYKVLLEWFVNLLNTNKLPGLEDFTTYGVYELQQSNVGRWKNVKYIDVWRFLYQKVLTSNLDVAARRAVSVFGSWLLHHEKILSNINCYTLSSLDNIIIAGLVGLAEVLVKQEDIKDTIIYDWAKEIVAECKEDICTSYGLNLLVFIMMNCAYENMPIFKGTNGNITNPMLRAHYKVINYSRYNDDKFIYYLLNLKKPINLRYDINTSDEKIVSNHLWVKRLKDICTAYPMILDWLLSLFCKRETACDCSVEFNLFKQIKNDVKYIIDYIKTIG